MKKVNLILALVATLLIILIACMWCADAKAVTVPEGYVGIVVKRGAAQDETLAPGKHRTNPFTTDVVLMDTRWQKYTAQTSAFSKDIQQVDIVVSMSYQIKNTGALTLYKEVGLDYADKIMLPCLLDALKSTFAKYSAEDLISKRELISDEVLTALEEQLIFYKLEVREVAIEDIDFTDAFTNAIEEKQVATQRLLQVETEQQQQTIIAKSEAERATIQATAEAEQKLIRAQADADAVKIAADAEAYRLEMESKHITEAVIQKETVEKWDGKLPAITGTDAVPLINFDGVGAGV